MSHHNKKNKRKQKRVKACKKSAKMFLEPSFEQNQPIISPANTGRIIKKFREITLVTIHYYLFLLTFFSPIAVSAHWNQRYPCDSPDGVDENCKEAGGQMYYFITCSLTFAGMRLKPYMRETQCQTYGVIMHQPDSTCETKDSQNPRLITNDSVERFLQALGQLDPNASCSFISQKTNLNNTQPMQPFFEDKKMFSKCFTNLLLNGFFGLLRRSRTYVQGGFENEMPPANVSFIVLNTMQEALSKEYSKIKEHADQCLIAGYSSAGATVLGTVVIPTLICCAICCLYFSCIAIPGNIFNWELPPPHFEKPWRGITNFFNNKHERLQRFLWQPKKLNYEPIPDGPPPPTNGR